MSSGLNLRLVHDALNEASGRQIPPKEFATAITSEAAARYLSQGLPGYRGDLPEWSYQATFHEGWATLITRYWWPRFVAPIDRQHGLARIAFVMWTDDPGEHREEVLKRACELFRLRMPDSR